MADSLSMVYTSDKKYPLVNDSTLFVSSSYSLLWMSMDIADIYISYLGQDYKTF